VALLIATLLIVVMMIFEYQMSAQRVVWEDADADLSLLQVSACRAARVISGYWYVFVPLIVSLCLAAAALLRKRRVETQPV
jgi:hypothetical protein